jgi:hypothetical protein
MLPLAPHARLNNLPRVLKSHDLGTGAGAVFFGEEDVVILSAVEGRVKVDEIDRLVLDVLTEDGQVIAVIELILLHGCRILARSGVAR